jgi:hypothetical protein
MNLAHVVLAIVLFLGDGEVRDEGDGTPEK